MDVLWNTTHLWRHDILFQCDTTASTGEPLVLTSGLVISKNAKINASPHKKNVLLLVLNKYNTQWERRELATASSHMV